MSEWRFKGCHERFFDPSWSCTLGGLRGCLPRQWTTVSVLGCAVFVKRRPHRREESREVPVQRWLSSQELTVCTATGHTRQGHVQRAIVEPQALRSSSHRNWRCARFFLARSQKDSGLVSRFSLDLTGASSYTEGALDPRVACSADHEGGQPRLLARPQRFAWTQVPNFVMHVRGPHMLACHGGVCQCRDSL